MAHPHQILVLMLAFVSYHAGSRLPLDQAGDTRPLPPPDQQGRMEPGGGGGGGNTDWDKFLLDTFPGVFYTEDEIALINEQLTCTGASDEDVTSSGGSGSGSSSSPGRSKRELASDGDMCCKTHLWFGSAPTTMTDTNDTTWTLLSSDSLYQGYTRGDCHPSNPQDTCPPRFGCQQIQRLHLLWVQDGGKAVLRYFRINSHCACHLAPPTALAMVAAPDVPDHQPAGQHPLHDYASKHHSGPMRLQSLRLPTFPSVQLLPNVTVT